MLEQNRFDESRYRTELSEILQEMQQVCDCTVWIGDVQPIQDFQYEYIFLNPPEVELLIEPMEIDELKIEDISPLSQYEHIWRFEDDDLFMIYQPSERFIIPQLVNNRIPGLSAYEEDPDLRKYRDIIFEFS